MPGSSLPRSAGILLHPTSLPGPGIGDVGASARRFAGVVARMQLRWWQMLPVGPTGYGDSPYQSPSTFAGNPLLISTEDLVELGLARPDEAVAAFDPDRVDYGAVIPWKMARLAAAADRFTAGSRQEGFAEFLDRHRDVWLRDFAEFTAIKRATGLRPWWEWDEDLRLRRPTALRRVRSMEADAIRTIEVEQYLFDLSMRRLRERCQELGVGLIGDIPIFVAHDSADVWAHPHLFDLDAAGMPAAVAGVPPDYFSKTGQRWGNPLYDWEAHVASGFAWWTERMRRSFELFDLVRIDHFRGFAASWRIPADHPTAEHGTWVDAPGRALFTHLRHVFSDLPVIAEDLGVITPDVEALRDEFGLPGMKVLQFGFGTESTHALERFREHVVAYTGTHDNDTAVGWFRSPDPRRRSERRRALRVLGGDGADFAWDLIRGVFESIARLAVVPLQDILGLDSTARMNTPAVEAGNWRWRFRWDAVTPRVEQRVADLVRRTGRSPQPRMS